MGPSHCEQVPLLLQHRRSKHGFNPPLCCAGILCFEGVVEAVLVVELELGTESRELVYLTLLNGEAQERQTLCCNVVLTVSVCVEHFLVNDKPKLLPMSSAGLPSLQAATH